MNLSDTCDRIRELLLSNDVSLDSGDASDGSVSVSDVSDGDASDVIDTIKSD